MASPDPARRAIATQMIIVLRLLADALEVVLRREDPPIAARPSRPRQRFEPLAVDVDDEHLRRAEDALRRRGAIR